MIEHGDTLLIKYTQPYTDSFLWVLSPVHVSLGPMKRNGLEIHFTPKAVDPVISPPAHLQSKLQFTHSHYQLVILFGCDLG